MGACVIVCGQGNEIKEDHSKSQIIRTVQDQLAKEYKIQRKEEDEIIQQEIFINTTSPKLTKSWKTQSRSRFYKEKCYLTLDQNGYQNSNSANQPPSCIISDLLEKTTKKYKKFQLTKQQWLDQTQQSSQRQRVDKENISENERKFIFLRRKKLIQLSSIGLTEKDQNLIQSTVNTEAITKISEKIEYINLSFYQGEWKNGLRHGHGKMTWTDGAIYQGQWKLNNLQGFGKLTYNDKQSYYGQFINNKAEGKGEYHYSNNSRYVGEWSNNLPEGKGRYQFSKDQWYDGGWVKGKKSGYGELFYEDHSYYKGDFLENEIHGFGEYDYGERKYVGGWQHNQKSGKGTITWKNGNKYQGEFFHDKMHGKGKYFENSGVIYQGKWINGRKEGIFLQYHPNKQIIKSQWYYNKLLRKNDNKKSL